MNLREALARFGGLQTPDCAAHIMYDVEGGTDSSSSKADLGKHQWEVCATLAAP